MDDTRTINFQAIREDYHILRKQQHHRSIIVCFSEFIFCLHQIFTLDVHVHEHRLLHPISLAAAVKHSLPLPTITRSAVFMGVYDDTERFKAAYTMAMGYRVHTEKCSIR